MTTAAPKHEQEALETPFNTAEYVREHLNRRDFLDNEGIARPVYVIQGREVAFRNRQEAPTYDDTDVNVVGGSWVYPLEKSVWNDKTASYETVDGRATKDYVDTHQKVDAPRLMVTNTPEGMLTAAAALVESEEESKRLLDLAHSFAGRKEWTDDHRDVLDTMLAAVSVDDEGNILDNLNLEGWPVALAALSGDSFAKEAITNKRQALAEAEKQRAADPAKFEQYLEHARQYEKELEPIPLDQLAFVHSTSYDVERNEDGNVVLRTAGQLRDDGFARATLHGTLNSQVGDVYAGGEKHEWSDENKLIVANLKAMIDANQKMPNRMDGIDTEFTLNPGEELVLPSALVVERVAELESGAVIEETDSGVKYIAKSEYSADEMRQLSKLSEKYGVSEPKELALRVAMARVGVPVELMDQPSSDGHGMYSHKIGERISATAAGYGLALGKHFETPEDRAESEAFFNHSRIVGKIALHNEVSLETEGMGTYSQAAIEARRQTLANGLFPARAHVSETEAAAYDEELAFF